MLWRFAHTGDRCFEDEMEELIAYRARLLAQAEEQLPRLQTRLRSFNLDELHAPLERGGWSPHQVLAHLRDVEKEAFLPRFRSMLREQTPLLPYFDESQWMEQHYDQEEAPEAMVAAFAAARRSELDDLQAADPQGWSREGRHPTQGIKTVQWWFEYCVQHTEEHLRQLAGISPDQHPTATSE
jgi:hypothetical protein